MGVRVATHSQTQAKTTVPYLLSDYLNGWASKSEGVGGGMNIKKEKGGTPQQIFIIFWGIIPRVKNELDKDIVMLYTVVII